jgi:hypothetical protein
VWSNCEELPSVKFSNIVGNTIEQQGGALFGYQGGMKVTECVFNGNAKNLDVYREGKGERFRLSRCAFDGELPDAEYCDFVEGIRVFVKNGIGDGPEADGGRICERASFKVQSNPLESEGVTGTGGKFVTIGIVLAGVATLLSVGVFVYVLIRSREQEKHPNYDSVCEERQEEQEVVQEAEL